MKQFFKIQNKIIKVSRISKVTYFPPYIGIDYDDGTTDKFGYVRQKEDYERDKAELESVLLSD